MFKEAARKRLLKDLKEIESNPLDTIYAQPLENDLFEWHANLVGISGTDYEGVVFHLIMEFPADYPLRPPKVRMASNMQHRHVYGTWICLDMLEAHPEAKQYSGWSSSYSVYSILLQLQAFLFADKMSLDYEIAQNIYEARSLKCFGCKHTGYSPWPTHERMMKICKVMPTINITKKMTQREKKKMKKKKKAKPKESPSKKKVPKITNIDEKLPKEMLVEVLDFLEKKDLVRVEKVSENWKSLAQEPYLNERKETICFHSKASFEEDVLGVGIKIFVNPRTKLLQYVASPLDLLSYTAYSKEGVRMSVWRDRFTHFLPLYINEVHGKKSLPLAEKCLSKLFGVDFFKPEMALNLLSKLMNTQVVDVMSGEIHASIKALEGYSYFHRLLIAFVQKYPQLLKIINEHIAKFIHNPKIRSKKYTPSMGDFLPLLSVSNYNWNQVSSVVLQEIFDRNAFWILKKYPEISLSKISDEELISKSFDATLVSLRLIMFHVHFLLNIARPNNASLDEIAKQYDQRYGRPTQKMQEELQNEIFKIQKVDNYSDFFKRVRVNPKLDVPKIIRKCIQNSIEKGYHPSSFAEVQQKRLERQKYMKKEAPQPPKDANPYYNDLDLPQDDLPPPLPWN